MKKLTHMLIQQLSAGNDLVLATIVAASGSTPRGVGSRMIIGKDGLIGGTIGGGSVEYRSIQIALQFLEDRTSCEHFFLLNKDDVSNLGMVCGGDVNVFFHFLDHKDSALLALFRTAEDLFIRRTDFWLISDLCPRGSFSLYVPGEGCIGADLIPDEIIAACSSRPSRITSDGNDYFTEQIGFSETVYIFGGGHVSQSLVPALAAVDFKCVVLDDREEFTSPALFPQAEKTILCDFNHLEEYITVTENDLCCVMTRGHSYDTDVQAFLLHTPAYYIGVIGSRSKKAAVFKKLTDEFHIPESQLERIVTPIGLSIKAETPAEIAVSITAQMILARAEKR